MLHKINFRISRWTFSEEQQRGRWLHTDVMFPTEGEPFRIEFIARKTSVSNVVVELDDITVEPSREEDCGKFKDFRFKRGKKNFKCGKKNFCFKCRC